MKFKTVMCILGIALMGGPSLANPLTVTHLSCERLINPTGIDTPKPHFSWNIASGLRSEKQSAYQIIVSSGWDSGRVSSDQSLGVAYGGPNLKPATCYTWRVRVWDETGKASPWSAPAVFSTGLKSWSAKWIGCDKGLDTNAFGGSKWIWFPEGNPAQDAPIGVRYFRRTISLPLGKMAAATCEISADNAFKMTINGQLAAQGDYWGQSVSVNVAPFLHQNTNIIEVEATNEGTEPNPAGLIAKFHFASAAHGALDVVTDDQWQASSDKKSWTGAIPLGAYGMQPWGYVLEDDKTLPARYLRREFHVPRTVARATAYVCGLGCFDLFLNGAKVSDDVMDPAISDFAKADYYVTFDVTKQIRRGSNAIGVILGNGRFYSPRALALAYGAQSFGYPKLLLELVVEYTDGSKSRIISDGSWRLTTNGPIRANNEYDGEEYDARMEMPGWDSAGFNDAAWQKAQLVAAPGGALRSQMIEPMKVTQVIHPVSITKPMPGTYIVDLGQTIYGNVRVSAHGPRGARMTMVTSYSLKPDGTLKTADNRSARSTDVYTFKGSGLEVWSPRFRGQGFRRIQLNGFPGIPTRDNFEGLSIHTAVEPVGEFECSNGLVNRIHAATLAEMKMFLRSAPLDPDRDERMPWMGDPAKDAESDAYNLNVSAFYAKWMDDVQRSQRPDGSIPDVSMYWTGGDGVEWPSVFTIIPDWYIDFYGDNTVAQSHYDAMKHWVLAMRRHQLSDGTLTATSFGDWCDTYSMDGKGSDFGSTPRALVSTAYQYHNCRIMERLAQQLPTATVSKGDGDMFGQMADNLKTAFNRKFFDASTNTYEGNTQCGYVLALKFGLVPEDHRNAVIARLVDDIMVKHHGHLTVGLIGMQWLMQTLSDIGRPDVAWTIATQTTRPSWGYMLSKGSTTIWERWDYDTRDPGMNSEALLIQAGNLDAWFYQTLGGIRPAAPGFKKILIEPSVVGDLTWVKSHFDSPYGRIVSNWQIKNHQLTMNVAIPPNTTATVIVPGKNGSTHNIGSGSYQFTERWSD